MTVENENIVAFDVDDTLVMHGKDGIEIDMYGRTIKVRIHQEHINLLKNYRQRGFFIIVWSGNGFKWAETVVNALGLINDVNLIMTKPSRYIDDKDSSEWLGGRIFLEEV